MKGKSFYATDLWDACPMNLRSLFEGAKLTDFNNPPVGFDIETYSPNGFPCSQQDPVVNFSLAIPLGGGLSIISFICNPVSERVLLNILKSLLNSLNGGALLTYNGTTFDIQYVMERGKVQGLDLSRVFSNFQHIDLYRLIRRLDIPLPRYSQKYVEKIVGVQRVVNDISGMCYHFVFDNFVRNGDLSAAFYNIEDSVGCLRIGERLSSIRRGQSP